MRMLILSVDSSATPASVCLYDGRIISEYYVNTELTHSQTLVAMIESVLKVTDTDSSQIDCYAVNNGPGSFTGVRIGVSAVKGMAYAAEKPCAAVSTLESIAYNCLALDGVVCACMDARRQQVYNALFRVQGGTVTRLCDDRAIAVDELVGGLSCFDEPVWLAGDGAELVYRSLSELKNIHLAPENLRYQRASSAAIIAEKMIETGETIPAASLMPSYLRLSQAEREMQNKRKDEIS